MRVAWFLVGGLLVVGLAVFGAGVFIWAQRNMEQEAAKEARVACGFFREALKPAPDITETFVRFMLREAATHAVRAGDLDPKYERFGDGMSGLAASAGSELDTLDVMAVNEVCGPV